MIKPQRVKENMIKKKTHLKNKEEIDKDPKYK